jgi:hypothetical protein
MSDTVKPEPTAPSGFVPGFTPGKAGPVGDDPRHNRVYPHPKNPGLFAEEDGFYDWADRRLFLADGSPDPMTPGAYRYQTRPDLCDLDASDADPSSPRYEPDHLRHKPGDTWIIDKRRPYDVLDPGPFGAPGWFPDRRTGRHRRDELPDPIPWWEIEEEPEKAEWAERAEALWERRTRKTRAREELEARERQTCQDREARDQWAQKERETHKRETRSSNDPRVGQAVGHGTAHDDDRSDGGHPAPGEPPVRESTERAARESRDDDERGERRPRPSGFGGHANVGGGSEAPRYSSLPRRSDNTGATGTTGPASGVPRHGRADSGRVPRQAGADSARVSGHAEAEGGIEPPWIQVCPVAPTTPTAPPSGPVRTVGGPIAPADQCSEPYRFGNLREDAWDQFLLKSEQLAAAHHQPSGGSGRVVRIVRSLADALRRKRKRYRLRAHPGSRPAGTEVPRQRTRPRPGPRPDQAAAPLAWTVGAPTKAPPADAATEPTGPVRNTIGQALTDAAVTNDPATYRASTDQAATERAGTHRVANGGFTNSTAATGTVTPNAVPTGRAAFDHDGVARRTSRMASAFRGAERARSELAARRGVRGPEFGGAAWA